MVRADIRVRHERTFACGTNEHSCEARTGIRVRHERACHFRQKRHLQEELGLFDPYCLLRRGQTDILIQKKAAGYNYDPAACMRKKELTTL